jgi:two-component system sensor histidine kinase KdpD
VFANSALATKGVLAMLTDKTGHGRKDPRQAIEPRRGMVEGTAAGRKVTAAVLQSIERDVSRPLAMIAGAAVELKNGAPSGDALAGELVAVIDRETRHLKRALSLLLDLAKLESGALEVHRDVSSIADAIRSAVRGCRGEIGEARLELILPADLPRVVIDPVIFRRVLAILLEDAAAQAPPQSRVTVQAGSDQTAVRVQVMDEGTGLALSGDALFRQYDLPCAESSGVSGISLTVCRGYVDAMGGTIAATNRSDRSGAVVTLTFPRAS